MDEKLRSKLLANDEISLEMESVEEQETLALTPGFNFYKNPDRYERAVRA
jgi:hypothetical protein